MPRQTLELTEEAIGAIKRWKQRLAGAPPLRRIVPCNMRVPTTWVMVLRYTPMLLSQEYRYFMATPSVCWSVAEHKTSHGKGSLIVCWMALLLEALQILDLSEGEPEVVIVRTNIKHLAQAIDSDCYVRSIEGAQIASEVHDTLGSFRNYTGEQVPIELKAVLLSLSEDRLSGCIAGLLN